MIILSMCALLVYLCYSVWVAKGVPESISATYYLLKGKGFLFQLTMFVVAATLFFPWIEATEECYEFLPFLSCGSLLFVAIAPQFKLRLEGMVHYSFAIVCGVSSALWMFLRGCGDTFLFCFICALVAILFRPKQYMFWLECGIVSALLLSI